MFALSTDTAEVRFSFGSPGKAVGQLDWPLGVAITPDGQRCIVCDAGNKRLQCFSAVDGAPLQQIECGLAPYGVAISGHLAYVSACRRPKILSYDIGSASSMMMSLVSEDAVPGALRSARNSSLAFISAGSFDHRLLVCDEGSHCVYSLAPLTARMRRFRLAARLIAALLALWRRSLDRVYAPGMGVGYAAAASSFATSLSAAADAQPVDAGAEVT